MGLLALANFFMKERNSVIVKLTQKTRCYNFCFVRVCLYVLCGHLLGKG